MSISEESRYLLVGRVLGRRARIASNQCLGDANAISCGAHDTSGITRALSTWPEPWSAYRPALFVARDANWGAGTSLDARKHGVFGREAMQFAVHARYGGPQRLHDVGWQAAVD